MNWGKRWLNKVGGKDGVKGSQKCVYVNLRVLEVWVDLDSLWILGLEVGLGFQELG